MAFGNRHFAPEGARSQLLNASTGTPADPVVFDRMTGRPIAAPDYAMVPGRRRTSASARAMRAARCEPGAA